MSNAEEATDYLVVGPGHEPGTLIFHARVKARPSKDGTHLQKRCEQTIGWARSHVCPGSRRPSWRAAVQRLGCSTAPFGTTPLVRYCHSATMSLRAIATMVMRRMRPFMLPTRSWNQRLTSLPR